jgi:hypothetical protein
LSSKGNITSVKRVISLENRALLFRNFQLPLVRTYEL